MLWVACKELRRESSSAAAASEPAATVPASETICLPEIVALHWDAGASEIFDALLGLRAVAGEVATTVWALCRVRWLLDECGRYLATSVKTMSAPERVAVLP